MSIYAPPRTNLTDLQSLSAHPPFGAEGGIATKGDILVYVTADGVDLNIIWAEVASVIKAWAPNGRHLQACWRSTRLIPQTLPPEP
jgi:hypothetical protein